MKNQFDFTTSYYFPGRLVWAVVTAIAAVAFFAAHYYALSAISVIVGIAALTTRYGVDINFDTKQYREYTWILGFKSGDRIPFDKVVYLFIKDFKISQTLNTRVNSATFTNDEFRGFIKFDNEEKVHLISRQHRETIIKDLKQIAIELRVGLVDYSFGQQERLV